MNHYIHASLLELAKPLNKMILLEGNPRKGDVDAIIASFKEFGQVEPIVVTDNGNDTFTVLAGNHRVEAARKLGWTEIAAVVVSWERARAITFAMVDNKTSQIGTTDESLLYSMLAESTEEYNPVLAAVGWDDFEIAALEEHFLSSQHGDMWGAVGNQGWTPPIIADTREMRTNPETPKEFVLAGASKEETEQAVTRGSTTTGQQGASVVVQYTLVFDHAEQQKDWYSFLRWLKSNPNYENDPTTAAQVIHFIQDFT